MKRRLCVIMMADIVGYSRTVEASPAKAIEHVRALRERCLEPLVEAKGGKIEKRIGDGWLATFPSANDAVEGMQEVQAGLASSDELKLRIALHIGEITIEHDELFGAGINIAARLESEAPPGGVLISSDCFRLLNPEKASEFTDAGTLSLKNISEPLKCFRWRPKSSEKSRGDDVPVIAVERISVSSLDPEASDAAADMHEQLLAILSKRSGIAVSTADELTDQARRNAYVLRGRLSRRGEVIRSAISLVLGENSQVVWSETYEGPSESLFEFADDVVRRVANALRIQINAFDGERLIAVPEAALSPSELRSRAAHAFHLGSIESHDDAERLLKRALTLDPKNPMSLAMMAYAITEPFLAKYSMPSFEQREWIGEAVGKAVRMAPGNDFVVTTRADMRIKLFGDFDGAQSDIQRVLKGNPTYAWGLDTEGRLKLAQGDYTAARDSFDRAIACDEKDPWLPRRYFMKSLAAFLSENFIDATLAIEAAIDLRQDSRNFWALRAKIGAAVDDPPARSKAEAEATRLPRKPDFYSMWINLPERDQHLIDDFAPADQSSES